MPTLPLVAVIGPAEPEMFRAFVDHYRSCGVTDILIAFHFTPRAPAERRQAVLDACHDLVGPPAIISQGPFHEYLHGDLRDHLRRRAGTGWQVLADYDEFHFYPAPATELIAAAEDAGSDHVGGVMLDRVTADGALAGWSPALGLDRSYPLGGFLTSRLLGGNPRKVVLAHSSVELILGSHRSPSGSPVNDPLVPVHHFKWRAGVQEDLRTRVDEMTSGGWREVSPATRIEATTLLEHLRGNDGRIDVTDPGLMFQPVSLSELPPGWAVASRDVATRYREFRRWSAPALRA